MAQAVPAAALMLRKQGTRPVPESDVPVCGIGEPPEVSSILPCAADFCLMSKPALPYKRDADEKRIGAVGAPGEEAR